jgi:YVTN family beta-propeller protein
MIRARHTHLILATSLLITAACNTEDPEENPNNNRRDMATETPDMLAPDLPPVEEDLPDAPDMPIVEPDMPPPPTCSEATPVCDPACSGSQQCQFNAGSCSCVNVCLPDAPVCPGNGPNAGCAATERCASDCMTCEPIPVMNMGLLGRPSRSTTVDIDPQDKVVVMVNSDNHSISVFNAETNTRTATVATSSQPRSEPHSVVISPDAQTAYVANRATGTVSRITNLQTPSPTLQGEASTGGEPMGLALSPTGAALWVTDWTAGTVSVINTSTMQITRTIHVGGNPYAIAITNNGDNNDDDEKVLVTQFFGRHDNKEAQDNGRIGVVHLIPHTASAPSKEILLQPKADCFTGMLGGNATTVACSPNQLYGLTIHRAFGKTRAYVSSVAASPAGPVNFNFNMQALISVIDVEAEVEEPSRAVNLNDLVKLQPEGERRFMNTLNAIDFVNADDRIIGYATAEGSDIVLRVVWDEAGGVSIGAPSNLNIPVGQNPTGIVVKHGSLNVGAYVSNLISRDLSFVLFRDQRTTELVTSTPRPQQGSQEFITWRGKRFFNTGTGIWSRESWGSCQSCHPFGLSDNITWSFAAGPRQSTSLDGQYAPNDPTDMRALNWTAIFDETDDFELNTRGVSGGQGTLRNAEGTPLAGNVMGFPFAGLLMEDTTTRESHQALNGSLRFVAKSPALCTNNSCSDFEMMDAYIKTLRSPRGKPATAALIQQGRAIFEDAGCNKCHAGAKWTISRTFYNPQQFSGSLPNRLFNANAAESAMMNPSMLTMLGGLPTGVNIDTTLIAGDDSDGGMPAFKRQACNIRNVGTFGAVGGAPEVRANNTPAQGSRGFNVPSLLGLNVGAPYLHNDAAKDLADLFDARFVTHTTAGNPNFAPNAADREALIAFLLSIDESTPIFPINPNTVLCPTTFP